MPTPDISERLNSIVSSGSENSSKPDTMIVSTSEKWSLTIRDLTFVSQAAFTLFNIPPASIK